MRESTNESQKVVTPKYTTRIIGSERVRVVACPRCNK